MKWISEDKAFDIRYSDQKDLYYLNLWMQDTRIWRWYPVSSSKDVENMTRNWIGFSRFRASLTALYNNDPIAIATLFLMPYRKTIHHCLLYLIVHPEYRSQGVGTALLRNSIHLATSNFQLERVHAEVYEGCACIPLLQRAQFNEVARQERYIKEADGTYLARLIYELECKRKSDGT